MIIWHYSNRKEADGLDFVVGRERKDRWGCLAVVRAYSSYFENVIQDAPVGCAVEITIMCMLESLFCGFTRNLSASPAHDIV